MLKPPPDKVTAHVPATRLEFDPVDGPAYTQGVEGHFPSQPGKAKQLFRAYFDPPTASVVVVFGSARRTSYQVSLADLGRALKDADPGTPAPADFFTTGASAPSTTTP